MPVPGKPFKLSLELVPLNSGTAVQMELKTEGVPELTIIRVHDHNLLFERVQEDVNNILRRATRELQQQLRELRLQHD